MREEVASHYRSRGYTIRERVQVRGRSGAVHAVEMVAQGPLGNLVIAFEDAGGFEGPELDAVRRAARDIGATPVVAARRFDDRVRTHAAQSGVVVLDEETLHAPAPAAPVEAEELEYPPWPGSAPDATSGEEPPAWPSTARGRPADVGRLEPTELDEVVAAWGRPAPPAGKSTDPGFWRYPRPGAAATLQEPMQVERTRRAASFDWLPTAVASERPDQGTTSDARHAAAVRPAVASSHLAAPMPVPAQRQSPADPAAGGATAMPARPADASARLADAVLRSAGAHRPTAAASVWRWLGAAAVFGASTGAVVYALLRWLG